MMNENVEQHNAHGGFPWKHVIGLILSLALTLIALWIVVSYSFSTTFTLASIIILAIFQALIQLLFFMHLNESKSRVWQIIAIGFGFFTAATVVVGSLWIMAYSL
ncbi:cytochrome aa3 quinol oxidase subunit 4 [Scopulibacillus darangshiensis]|uniref:Quinol oxidase subunit 4 n=1 Tax=Scopulibacillus darangshiensis TaxID=442528 RepID=A0A4R2NHY7_9BACL|nr:cytochrome aa3 quinol oxidase subunit IV [Scopulibacillus darangshiensis]TCP20862.1 cytochrome aa3 quinol oxidase subunit 4 [Scopulibacillus darangshiensis]